jgi:hypothetical protein
MEAAYAQQLYWILNTYFLSVRLIEGDMISGKPPPNSLHLNKIGTFFTKFKKIF